MSVAYPTVPQPDSRYGCFTLDQSWRKMGKKRPDRNGPQVIEDWELSDLDIAIGGGFGSSFLTKRSLGATPAEDAEPFSPADPSIPKG